MKKSLIFLILLLQGCLAIAQTTTTVTPHLDTVIQTIKPYKVPVVQPVTPPPPITNSAIINWDGKNWLTINGGYTPGTIVTVKGPGTIIHAGINLSNIPGVTVRLNSVVLDGNIAGNGGYYMCLTVDTNVNNMRIEGLTTQNNGYHSIWFNKPTVGVALDSCTFINCAQGLVYNGGSVIWDGTDKTVIFNGFSITNSIFNNVGQNSLGGSWNNPKAVINLSKNFTFSHNTVNGGNPGDIWFNQAIDGYNITYNNVSGVNLTDPTIEAYDNRLFLMVGDGGNYSFNNVDNSSGHAYGAWPVNFGSVQKPITIHDNTFTNSKRYAMTEMQEFANYIIPGITITVASLVIMNNTAGNLGLDKWTGYAPTFIDNYQGIALNNGCQVTLTNNIGYNWFPVPAKNVFWNLTKPTIVSGNVYTATKQ